MTILLTGASGFLGKNIRTVLCDQHIISVGRNEATIVCDLAKEAPKLPQVDIVIHAAGKAHVVPKTEKEKLEFFEVNVKGTQNLLKSLETALPKFFVLISSVAVYGKEKAVLIDESIGLTATDAYGCSKMQAEEVVSEWCRQHGVVCTILRLPLLVGINPPGNLGAMIKGIQKGYYVNIAGGKAKKSMVLAEDVAGIIPVAAEKGGIYNLTDGYHPTFLELSAKIAQELGKSMPVRIPSWLAGILAIAGDILGRRFPLNSDKLKKISSDLTFDDKRARRELGWNPRKVTDHFTLNKQTRF